MAPGCSPEPRDTAAALIEAHGATLLDVALASIEHGIAHGRPIDVEPAAYAPALRAERASFVTLHVIGTLRGCIGKTRACSPLVSDVAENAFAAAFDDERFEAVRGDEIDDLEIGVSVLNPPEPIRFSGEADLLAKLRPGTDGVILECGAHRGLFLPDVWEALPEPRDFLAHLKIKAGLSADDWPPDIAARRFTTASLSRARSA
ncbi:MAG: AmmeMemoRadiSam system protein A [Alphaproteobacteria bacterium]